MSPFGIDVLIWPASAIFVCTLAACLLFRISPLLSVSYASIKAGIYLVYFNIVFDGAYTFNDDWKYIAGAQELLSYGVGLTNILEEWEFVLATAKSQHFAYYLHNAFAFRLFGEGYFSPVALNVLLTVGVAYFGAKLASVEFNMSKKASRLFFLFLLFHPDILAWSSIANLKDVLVLFLHVLLLAAVSQYLHGQLFKALWLGLPVVFVLFFLRFYVPMLFVVALVATHLLINQRWNISYLMVSFGLAVLALVLIGDSAVQYAIIRLNESFVNPLYGFIRFVSTPIPFNAQGSYAFLNVSALIHWALMPFVLVGLVKIWRTKTQFSRFFIMYLIVFVGLYSVYGELQGPRHRVQLDYAFALLQFVGVMVALRSLLQNSCRYEG